MISHVISPWPRWNSSDLAAFPISGEHALLLLTPSGGDGSGACRRGRPCFVWVDGWGGLFPPKKTDLDSMNCWEIFVLLLRDTGRTFRRFWLCVVCICMQFSIPFACQSCLCLEFAFHWCEVLGMRLSGIPHQFDDLRAPRAGRHLIEFDVTQISHSLAIDDFIAQILTGQVEMDYTCKYVYNN